ncbi:MAG: copper-binding protein [Hyphomicrobiaceae bacterium]|nr:copper-binding protein [Hyphomicrobiaceae bacterium]
MRIALAIAALIAGTTLAHAEGDLSRKCDELPALVLGTDDAGYAVSQKSYKLVTGKCYALTIKSTGKKEYALQGPVFFRNMWLRKVEAGGMEIKATHLVELEYEDAAEAEIFFVPIVAGKSTLAAKGLEDKGVVIEFDVK